MNESKVAGFSLVDNAKAFAGVGDGLWDFNWHQNWRILLFYGIIPDPEKGKLHVTRDWIYLLSRFLTCTAARRLCYLASYSSKAHKVYPRLSSCLRNIDACQSPWQPCNWFGFVLTVDQAIAQAIAFSQRSETRLSLQWTWQASAQQIASKTLQ